MTLRILIISVLASLTSTVHSQSFFDNSLVHKVEINFYADNWDHLLDSLASEGTGTGSGTGRILATVTINESAFDSCGVRYKGNSSMDTTSNKNPFNIDLNYIIDGQEFQGKDKIKLANCFTDPSMLREALTYEIANDYMDAPRASFVELYINGEYRGIYTNTESIDNEFLDKHYGSSKNPFFKCDPVSFEIYGDNSNLAYHADTMAFDTLYDMKSAYGLEALQSLTYQLEFEPETIENYLDVDRALWFLALSSAFVHNDGYTAFGHNYYVYQMDNGKWSIVLWDVNMSFGGLLWNGTNLLPLGMDALIEQDPYLHELAYDFRPLIAHLLSRPMFKRMYTAHFKTIMEEHINNGYYMERAETMHDLIAPFVETEPYPHYEYDDFESNLYENVGFWADLRPGLQALMDPRADFIAGLPEFMATQPTISSVTVAPEIPLPFSDVTVTTEVTDAEYVQFAYRYGEHDYFIWEEMFDDGLHGDGAAGDGIYGIVIPVFGTPVQYYFYAENDAAGKFLPIRAAHEYFTLSPEKGLVINELSAKNGTIAMDEYGDYDDWIEFYNNTDDIISLSGYTLSDDPDQPDKWVFPDVDIESGGYLIVWADDDSLILDDLHANFKLSAGGEILGLYNPAGDLVDQVAFPDQFEDITWGRFENGTGAFDYLYPTFNAENGEPVGVVTETLERPLIYPNPAIDQVTIQYQKPIETPIYIMDMNGQIVLTHQLTNQNELTLDISSLAPGIYLILDTSMQATKLIVK
jgi:hypothetical protein